LNLDNIFALTGELGHVHGKQNISDSPPCRKMVIFVTKFVFSVKLLLSMKSNELEENGFSMEEFQKYFSIPLFTIIFRPKIVILCTDSILRVKTIYESAK
jgi:hypothetical protein